MTILNKQINFHNITYSFVYVIVGILAINKGIIYYPDSYTFLEMAFNHSPIYCTFLSVLTGIFGDNFEIPLILVQYIIIAFGVDFLIKTLKNIFNLHFIGFILIQLIALAPCVYLHFLPSTILSEALSYPLLLIIFAYTLKLFVEEKPNYIYKIILPLFLLILTRGQFIILIPVLIVIVSFIIYKNKTFIKNFRFLVILIIFPLITSLSERVYNKVVFGYYVNNAMNYVHLISSPFYISNNDDINLFSEQDEKTYFKLINNSLSEAKLTRDQNLSIGNDDYQFYQNNFTKICNKRIYKLGLKLYEDKGLDFFEQNIALNKLCSKMVFPLIKQNFKNWFVLFFKNLKNSFGSSKQFLLFIMLMGYSLFYLNKTNNNIYKFVALAALFMFANNTLIALVVHSIKRYVFYFDWVIFAIIILLFNEILKKNAAHES